MFYVLLVFFLAGCNSIYVKPNTLDTQAMIYAPRGGYSMQRSIKQVMEERGYKVHSGQLKSVIERDSSDKEIYSKSKNIRYSVIISERAEILRPVWCLFNGFWWWNFNFAISDRKTGTEIMSWRGRGCQNSSLRKLNDVLDELEMKDKTQTKKATKKFYQESVSAEEIVATLEEE